MNIVKPIVILMTTMLVISSYAVAENGKKYMLDIVDPVEGDFFSYDVDYSGMFQSFIDNPDMEVKDVESNIPPIYRIEMHSNKCINFSQECTKSIITTIMNITLIHDDDSEIYDDNTVMLMTSEVIIENSGNSMWSEDTTNTEIWMKVYGQDIHSESVEVTTEEVTFQGTSPIKISLGDSWTQSEESQIITTIRERTNGGDWETETTEESWSNTTNFNAESVGNVFVNGKSYDSIKVSHQEIGSNEKTITHNTEHGVLVKMEIYDDDEILITVITLNNYNYANEPTDDGILASLPGFSAIAAIAMLGVATIYFRENRIN